MGVKPRAPRLFVALLVISSVAGPLSVTVGLDIVPASGSLSGGTVLTLSGSVLYEADSTILSSVAVDIGGIPCEVLFRPSTGVNGSLTCTTGEYPNAREGQDSPLLTVTVTLNSSQYQSNTSFMYSWSSTPQIHYMDPSSIPVGHLLGFTGINLPTEPGDIEAVFIGEQPCDLINASSNQPYGNYTREHTDPFVWIQCLPRQMTPGVYNVSVTVGNGVGRAWRHSNSKYYGPGGRLIMLEVFADIQTVQPSASHPDGGELITITGVGLGCGMTVDIDGVPCGVVQSSFSEIKCVTGAAPAGHPAVSEDGNYPDVQEGYRFKGGRGVTGRVYLDIGSSSDIINLYGASKYPDNPDYYFIYPSYQPERFRRYDGSGEISRAFFTPQETTTYVLWFEADNEGELFFGRSANISNVTRIGYVPDFNRYPFGTALVRNAYLKHDSQIADPMELVKGKSYIILGAAKEGQGHDYIRAMALLPNSTYMKNESGWVIQDEPGWPDGYFMRPLPGFMLQTVEDTPQVHLSVNGLLASCLEGHRLFFENPSPYNGCSFVYRKSRPRIARSCPNTWELSWNISILRNTSLVNYTITLDSEGSETRMLNVTRNDEQPEELTLVLPTLSLETEYTATITGTMADGISFQDSVVFYTESCDAPTPPLGVSFTFSCPYHWLLSWGIPAVTNGEITHFEIEWIELSTLSSDMLQVSASETSGMYEVELEDLTAGMEYNVRVRGYNHNGAGKYSECLLIHSGICTTCTPSCMNGGTCTAELTCACSDGWTGEDCSQATCTPSCTNGGTCTAELTCACSDGWTGEDCSQVATCTPSCKNGGMCTSELTCSCSNGWTGEECSRDIGGSEVVVPGGAGPPVVVIVVVSIAVLLLCILLCVAALCLLWCCMKMNSRKRKRVGPEFEDKLPLVEAESAERLDANNTVMYGGKLAESGLDSGSDALDPSKCPHRIIHVTPFSGCTDPKNGTIVENQGFEQAQASETQASSEPLTDTTSLQVDAGDQDEPNSLPDGDHAEPSLPPPSPTSADSALLPTLTNAEEPSREAAITTECLLSEGDTGGLPLAAGIGSMEEKGSTLERDTCSLGFEEKPGSTQDLGLESGAIETFTNGKHADTASSHSEVTKEPSDLVAEDTAPLNIPSTPPPYHSQDDVIHTTPGLPDRRQPSGRGSPASRQPSGRGYPDSRQPSGRGSPDRRQPSGRGSPDSRQPSGRGSPDSRQPSGRGSPDSRQPSGRGSPDSRQPSGRGSPDSRQPSGRGSPDSGSFKDEGNKLELAVQSSSKADLSPTPLATETSTPIEQPFSIHEMNPKLDDGSAANLSQERLLPPDEPVSSNQHPPEGNGEPSKVVPADLASTLPPLPLSKCAATVTSSEQVNCGSDVSAAETSLQSGNATTTPINNEVVEEKHVRPKRKFLSRLSSRVKTSVKEEKVTSSHAEQGTDQGQHTEAEVGAANATEAEQLSTISLDLDEIFLQPELDADTSGNGAMADQSCNQFEKSIFSDSDHVATGEDTLMKGDTGFSDV